MVKYRIGEEETPEPIRIKLGKVSGGGCEVFMIHDGLEQTVLEFTTGGFIELVGVNKTWAIKAGLRLDEKNQITVEDDNG